MKSKRIEKYGQEVADAYGIIASYRWDELFVCSNCNGESFFEGKLPYSRRCLKCKKDTSPTAGTIFHGVRFPLNIALYIIKRLVESPYKPTSQELVNDVWRDFKQKIRDKTVWSFLIKLFNAMEIPEFEFSSFRSFDLYSLGDKSILSACGYVKGNPRYYALVEDKGKGLKIQSFLARYETELSDFSIKVNRNKRHNQLSGFSPIHYQAYLNFICFVENFNYGDNKFDALLKVLTHN